MSHIALGWILGVRGGHSETFHFNLWALLSRPNLKSCCMWSTKKQDTDNIPGAGWYHSCFLEKTQDAGKTQAGTYWKAYLNQASRPADWSLPTECAASARRVWTGRRPGPARGLPRPLLLSPALHQWRSPSRRWAVTGTPSSPGREAQGPGDSHLPKCQCDRDVRGAIRRCSAETLEESTKAKMSRPLANYKLSKILKMYILVTNDNHVD